MGGAPLVQHLVRLQASLPEGYGLAEVQQTAGADVLRQQLLQNNLQKC